jgi:hypothetical protein
MKYEGIYASAVVAPAGREKREMLKKEDAFDKQSSHQVFAEPKKVRRRAPFIPSI